MTNSILSQSPQHAMLSRRSLLATVPASALLTACGSNDLGSSKFGSDANSDKTIDHSQWDRLLQEYVSEAEDGVNLVNYEQWQTEAADELSTYLKAMQEITIEEYSRDEQFAFWVNLYNAVTVDVILKNLPLDSIRDIGLLGSGPWKDDAAIVSGRTLSLDNIEHGILRPDWKDVRIHYAVNCASIGCPNLATQAYTADNLEPMLEAAAIAYINHPRGFSGTPDNIIASNIYEWYQEDWGSVQEVLDHARRYATGSTAGLLANATSIDSYNYDWSLNNI